MTFSTNSNIFLIPYGGGSAASFRSYVACYPRTHGHVIPVELPGRGTRSHEEHAKSIQECAQLILQKMDTSDAPYILHGHCMGALLALEAIKLLEANSAPLPMFMVASGRNAPRHVNGWLRRVAELDDRGLFQELQELGGVPAGLSFAMAQPFLSAIRHDQAMFRDYDPGDRKISVPILALAGRGDKMTRAAALADWGDYTSKVARLQWLDGGHYFLLQQPERVAQALREFQQQSI
jgi:surfactin synthase thioesterase subunit